LATFFCLFLLKQALGKKDIFCFVMAVICFGLCLSNIFDNAVMKKKMFLWTWD